MNQFDDNFKGYMQYATVDEYHDFTYLGKGDYCFKLAGRTWQNCYWYQSFRLGEDEMVNLGYIRKDR